MTDSLHAWQQFTGASPESGESDDRWRWWNAVHRIQAAYEAAQPRDDLWQLADFKDADAALVPHVRQRIRSRARYEYSNNAIVARIVDVWVGDVCGDQGPALQVHSGSQQIDRLVEHAWSRWWRASNQAAKLRTAVKADAVDGEAVGVLIHNRRLLRRQGVALDVAGIEVDRLASPGFENANLENYIDGIHLDPFTREPVAYDLLKAHPGTEYLDAITRQFEAQTFQRDEVLHAFRRLRPEQHRGVTRYAPVLPLSGLHRKYLEAEVNRNTLRAAFAFVVKSMAPPDDGESGTTPEDQWWQDVTLPSRQGAGLFLPDGYDVTQFRPDGSANELNAFHEIIGAVVAGCFTMPVGRALGKYASSGYAGVRAEMLPYHRSIASDRSQVWEPLWLCPLYEAFLYEWTLTAEWFRALDELGLDPRLQPVERRYGFQVTRVMPPFNLYNAEFLWPGRELIVDPTREENSRKSRLAMGLTTREKECDAADIDEQDKRGAELLGIEDVAAYRRLVAQSIHGVPVAASPSPASRVQSPDPEASDDEGPDEEEPDEAGESDEQEPAEDA